MSETLLEIARAALEKTRTTKQRGLTVADVLRVFPGAKVIRTERQLPIQRALPCFRCGAEMRERVATKGLGRRHNILICPRCGGRR